MALILLTNDDGIEAEGLRSLCESLQGIAEIVIVAPDRERSAVSHGLTIRPQLELTEMAPGRFSLNGTPTDGVIHALANLLTSPPDLVISGINHGANLADDIMYSGTVAAAREASKHGIPALAVSQAYDDKPIKFHKGLRFVRSLVKSLLEKKASPGICLNMNIPVGRIRGVKLTRQGCTLHFPHFNPLYRGDDSGGSPDWAGELKKSELMLDFHAILDRHISITPLQLDQTDYLTARSLCDVMPDWFQARRLPRLGLIR